jgi:ABC-2 type transport system permease protein
MISKWYATRLIAGAELKSFWGSPSAGLAIIVFLGLSGFFFYNSAADYVVSALFAAARGRALDASVALFSQALSYIALVLMLVAPLVTMRSLTPGSRGGRLDFFQTMPLSGAQIIWGHYLAALISLSVFILLALAPFLLLLLADVGSLRLLVCAALGLLALGAAFGAVGLMCSAASRSSVGAALASLGLGGLLWVLGWAAPYIGYGRLGELWQNLAFMPRIARFALGILNFNDLLFFVLLAFLALGNAAVFLAARSGGGD